MDLLHRLVAYPLHHNVGYFVNCIAQRERERENLFAKSDNNIASNITQHTMAGCHEHNAHLCWQPMTKKQ